MTLVFVPAGGAAEKHRAILGANAGRAAFQQMRIRRGGKLAEHGRKEKSRAHELTDGRNGLDQDAEHFGMWMATGVLESDHLVLLGCKVSAVKYTTRTRSRPEERMPSRSPNERLYPRDY
jgi:hypothetical protein